MNENVTVCITPKGDKPVLHFSQFDNERVFTVTVLADDGKTAAVLTGIDIELRLRKTDSHVVTIAPESVADNVITFKTTEQMCACCGQNIASVVLMKDDMIISTLDILVDIQRDILSGGLTSESDIRNLTTQIEQIVPEVIGDDYYNKQEVDDLLAEHTFDPTNYYDKSDIDGLLDDKADKSAIASLIVQKDVAKAPIASFNTDLNDNLTKCIVGINPVQDLHGYSKPWSAGGGKNKLNIDNQAGISNEHIRRYVLNLPAGTYTVSAFCSSTASTDCAVLFIYSDDTNSPIQYLRNGNWSEQTINATKQVKQLNLYSSTGYSTSQYYTFTAINSLQVESGSKATSYEPYSNICPISGFSALNVTLADGDMQTVDTRTVNFGQTVYGGVADVTGGTVTSKYVGVDLGSLSWSYITSGNFPRFQAPLPTTGKGSIDNAHEADLICSNYANTSWANVTNLLAYNGYIAEINNGGFITIHDDNYTDAPTFKTAMSGVQIVYELATPIEITTTAENLTAIVGQNNVYADTNGDIEVRFTETIGNELGV